MSDVACPLAVAAEEHADNPALVARHRTVSFREYHEEAARAFENLERAGIGEGDIVGIILPHCLQYPMLLMALARLGAVACTLNPRYPVQALRQHLAIVGCREVVVPYGESDITEADDLHGMSPGQLLDGHPPSHPHQWTMDPDQPVTIVFTSGSTGTPKAALHSLGNHLASAQASNANIPVTAADRWLLSLPLYHIAGIGIVFRCLIGGGAVVIPDQTADLGKAIREFGVTHVSLVATQLYRLLQDKKDRETLAGLKAVLLGGGPAQEPLVRNAVELDVPLYTSYGLTESSTQITATAPGDDVGRLLTSGKPLIEEALSISNEGEILLGGSTRFLGYVNDVKLDLPLDREGLFHTGDLGKWDEEGYLIVTGRRDNQFVSGGENIQPEEIEQRLKNLDGVLDAVVVPRDDVEFGQVAVAFVRFADGAEREPEELKDALSGDLPRFKLPKAIYPWPDAADAAGMKPSRLWFADVARDMSSEAS